VFVDMDPPLDPTKEPPLKNCCKGGYIGCQAQDPDMSQAQFAVSHCDCTVLFAFAQLYTQLYCTLSYIP